MRAFEYANPTTLKDALALLGSSWADANILAGGTDLAALALPAAPKTVRGIAGVRLLILDEAAFMPPELFAAVEPMVAAMIASTTPKMSPRASDHPPAASEIRTITRRASRQRISSAAAVVGNGAK